MRPRALALRGRSMTSDVGRSPSLRLPARARLVPPDGDKRAWKAHGEPEAEAKAGPALPAQGVRMGSRSPDFRWTDFLGDAGKDMVKGQGVLSSVTLGRGQGPRRRAELKGRHGGRGKDSQRPEPGPSPATGTTPALTATRPQFPCQRPALTCHSRGPVLPRPPSFKGARGTRPRSSRKCEPRSSGNCH